MNLDYVDDKNFVEYAAHHYNNPTCADEAEFLDDLKRFKYIKRLFNKYESTGEMRERLVLNHIVILYNVFGEAATQMLFSKLEGHYHFLKPFLVLLNRMPSVIRGVNSPLTIIYDSDIRMEQGIVDILRKI